MRRRDLVRLLGSAAAVPALSGLSPERLLALALDVHARTDGREGGSPGTEGAAGAAFEVMDADQAETVATMAELIIPETNTPGARAAGVAEFIDLIVAEWYDADERERFLEGIAGVDARSRTTFGAPFTALSEEEQVALLRGLDAEVAALRKAAAARLEGIDPDAHFFAQMKRLTLYGYYTSEVGVNEELEYVVIPGRFDPCIATGLRREPEGS